MSFAALDDLIRVSWTGGGLTWEKIGRRSTRFFLVFLFGICAFVILPSFLEGKVAVGAKGGAQWIFLLQTASGNWTGAQGVVTDWWFAFSAIAAVLINNSLALVLVTLIWRWNIERVTMMKLNQAFVARDEMNKQALFRIVSSSPAMMELINVAFSEGERDWKEHLVEVFGSDDAGRVLSLLGENV